MALPWRPLLLACWATSALPAALAGQGDPPGSAAAHGLKLQQEYDGPRDTTTVTLVLEKGRHFIRWHRPRVTAIFQYPGRSPGVQPDSLVIEFRTQSPQYTSTNVLTITTSAGDRLTVAATGSRGYQRVQTTDHTLIFTLATADLDALLGATEGEMEVGGVRVRLERRHFLGLAALVQLVTPKEHSLTPPALRPQPSGARAAASRRLAPGVRAWNIHWRGLERSARR